jgi:hypothetical protein
MKYILRYTFGGIMIMLAIPFLVGCAFFSLWNWNRKGEYAIGEILEIIENLIKNR